MNDKEFQQKLLNTTFLFDLPADPIRNVTAKQIVDTLFSGREWSHKTDLDHQLEDLKSHSLTMIC